MEQTIRRMEQAMKESVEAHFVLPQLREMALACLEQKLSESMLFGKMTMLHYRMYKGEDDERIYRAAAAVELMILSLDMIDDVQDQDNPAVPWSAYRPEIALNLALGMLMIAQRLLLESGFEPERAQQAARLLSMQVLTAVHGQTLDLLNDIPDEDAYLAMVSQKSAALLVCGCMIGTVLATGEWKEQVRGYAEQLGIAAQIKNDIRDLANWTDKNDFLNRKLTLPTLFLLQAVTDEDRWVIDYYEGRLSMEEVRHRREELEAILEKTGTMLYSSVRMRTHYYRFLELLEQLELEEGWRDQMLALAE
ncbi:polyprenyl synthetase family protein [Paenibacillus pasadenensis]|uniref:Octaprenyl diphosphate synthase n=1 Tax=Paenibacillus pasadenensis TaxID=217090 RepID=A0A2N5N0I8_9BACL|nr:MULTISPECIES: polyprenyl synthetase family protein [Paenibacillus]PLT43835.1 Octaprenyl diphosphate synthase [Paenibacillus pasadenensis]